MIKLGYYNDGKEKWMSHEISIVKDDSYIHHYESPINVYGYGQTKEEALENFKEKFTYVMNELKTIEAEIFETDNIVDVDCFGREIK